ncbi:non-heme chloroperoxidase [Neoasaia chiangmaiensis NBRC 101099]|uniref:Arylesterase n=1 Tax=Neoasaia chiangmaiensis TaxID=320497 RepID=A0A1U9KN64_9PROT|nr:alpha/beta hydrolase [Neoasaia chiangmaiensis]AQS87208.1 arylesterase [Neoasaia chiangmaiensis]GBR38349.1 non-heme chloroperoxidase [Neoasaia chiangmaiensis NBRC 101099]GEN15939.1 arylesterase [Neoasaia chiangmaiensis]
MPFITTRDNVNLHVKDTGNGRPVLLIHGWPLTGDMWEYQTLALQEAGYRVITYDRRGFGQSSHPIGPYDYDTLAADLATIIEELDLTDLTLVGFSMGGGEVARYLSRYGSARIAGVALIASVVPGLLKSEHNPDGIEIDTFANIKSQIRKDRFHFLQEFGRTFYGVGVLHKPVSEALLNWSFILAVMASPMATLECVDSWSLTDFRPDLAAFNVPTLIIHGSGDATVPAAVSGKRAASLLPNAHYIEYEGAPHGLFATVPDRLNQDLLAFLNKTAI